MNLKKLKFNALPIFFGCCKNLIEKAPEILAESGAAAIGGPAALAASILIPPFIEQAGEKFKDKPSAEALLELYRESLAKALENCEEGLAKRPEITDDDRDLLKLWREGLSVSVTTDPMWAYAAEEDLPADIIRLISVDVRDAASYWPLLRAQLERWSDWFRYRRSTPQGSLAIRIPRQKLVLSAYLEGYLRANLPAALFEEFRPELTGPGQQVSFNQALLTILGDLREQVSPLDPLRSLESFKTADQAGSALQLLTASFRAIPYTGRNTDVGALLEWLHGGESVSFRTIVGRGGSGKTRLAFELLERLQREEPGVWHAGFLPKQRATEALDNEHFRRWRTRRPTLVIIDYAAACAEHLANHVVPELEEEAAWPLRFLLLERGADREQGWYATVRRAAGANAPNLFAVDPQPMKPLEAGERLHLFQAAFAMLRGYDAREGGASRPPLTLPSAAELEQRLSDERMRDPLAVLLAALVIFESGEATALRLDRSELALQVADLHEIPRLERLAGDAGKKQLLLHMAAFVTLTGSLTHDELREACVREQAAVEAGSASWNVSHLMEVLSNSAIPVSERSQQEGMAAEPVTPDIVGEALVLKAVSKHDANGTVLRAAGVKAGGTTRTLVRMVQDFDEKERDVALAWLTSMLRRKAGELSEADFWQIHAALPFRTTAMREANRDFYRAVAGATAPPESAPAGQVYLVALESWAIAEGGLGRREDAVRLMEQCMRLRRGLAATGTPTGAPADLAFLANLAGSLNTLAALQSEVGQRDAALRSIWEAVQQYRQLVAAHPGAFLHNLAGALNNLGNRQSDKGQRGAALTSIEEAVRKYRELVAAARDTFLPDLAASLNNLSTRQVEAGHREAALVSIREAVEIREQLAADQPDAFLPDLATSLNNLGVLQSEMGQSEAALASNQKAAEIRRKLANEQPEAFRPVLATSLNNLARAQSEMGQREAALASIREAVQIRDELASKSEAFLPALGTSLNNLSNLESEMEQREAALESIQKAVAIRRRLIEAHREAFLPDLAMSLNNLANRQSETGEGEAAVTSMEEAVRHYRELAGAERHVFLPDLARSFKNLGKLQGEIGQRDAALVSIGEAVQCYRELAAAPSDAFLSRFAASLSDLSDRQSEMGQRELALASIAEAVELYRQLAGARPEIFLPDLARTLFAWGLLLKGGEGLRKLAEGLRLITPLAQRLPQTYLPVAQTLGKAYIEACDAAQVDPDIAVLTPILELIERQKRPAG